MIGMANLQTELSKLLNRHRHSENPEVQDLVMDLEIILASVPTPAAYQYRHHMGWDNTWMDLDQSQLEHVLKHGHTVERRPLADGWELVAEVPA